MTKKLLFFTFFTSFMNAQFIVSPNPFNINSGTITITYGSANNYSLFDPLNDQNLFLYTGLETDGVISTWDYHDNFLNTATQTPLTFNSTLGYYVATLNIGTRTYLQEPSLVTTTIPTGVNVNNWYFLIRNGDGTRQSADLVGTNYGFAPLSLGVKENDYITKNILFLNNEVISNLEGLTTINIYNFLGQKIRDFVIDKNEKIVLDFGIKNVYFAVISNNSISVTTKFIN